MAYEIPNVVLGSEPHTDIITSAKRPNMWSLDRKPIKPKGMKKRGGSNLMDTGPDDDQGSAFGAPQDTAQAAADTQALSQGIQTQGGTSPAVQQYEQALATGRQDIGGGVGEGGAHVPSVYGFREREAGPQESVYAPPPPTEAPPQAAPQQRAAAPTNLMDSGPDDSPVSAPETRRDQYGRVYRVGSASDPYASQRGGGLPFELPGTEDLPFPGVTGAILGGVSGISNRNLDKIEDKAQLDPSDPEYDARYSYGEVGNQRFGTSAGFIPGTTVVSGPSELRGLGVNTTVPNTAENQQKLLEAQRQDEYKSASGNTYVGQAATNKREADEEAQARGYGSAVTDSSGKAVRDRSGDVVTSGGRIVQEEESVSQGGSDDNDSGGGK